MIDDIETVKSALIFASTHVMDGDPTKKLLLQAQAAFQRIVDRTISNEVIAARFIAGEGLNQQIVYWDKDNQEDKDALIKGQTIRQKLGSCKSN